MDNKKSNSTFMFGSCVFSLMLIMLIINISFAWYSAKVNQGNVDLVSEGIVITLNDHEKISPDVLKEGVLTMVDGKYVLPSDYEANKSNYVAETGYSPEVHEAVELYLEGSKPINLEFVVTYTNSNDVEVNITEYFTITYSLVLKNEDKGSLLATVDNVVDSKIVSKTATTASITTTVDGEQTNNLYDLHIKISYNTPNELLPHDLLTSSIVLTVKGSI